MGNVQFSARALISVVVAVLVPTAIAAVFLIAPEEATMGDAQRILYIHVSVAWFSLFAFIAMATTAGLYLVQRDLRWDHWSHAAAEVGWLCCGLTLVTGSLWAHEAWGTWWTWDPRLTTALVLWLVYSGCLVVRGAVRDPHRRARLGAVLAIVGLLDIPLVVMATRWFRGIHPVSPEMEPTMRLVLLLCVVSFTALFATLVVCRQSQLRLEHALAAIDEQTQTESQHAF